MVFRALINRARVLVRCRAWSLFVVDPTTRDLVFDMVGGSRARILKGLRIRAGHGIHEFGSIRVDLRHSEVTRDGKPVSLTAREFQLLRYLVERPGTTVPRVELLRFVWGYDTTAFTRTVDIHIGSLRHKLESNPKRPELIVTVSGVGYKFMGSSGSASLAKLS